MSRACNFLTAAIAGALALSARAGIAQDAAPVTAGPQTQEQLEEIVVNARKVEENLQRVPVAVTAFSGAALIEQNARVVADVALLTPGLTIREAGSTGTGSTFQIRGQFQNDVLATLDPSVGVYVDDYYWARAYGINADLLDVRTVQTLKGPQGTLFGRNTTGGAILIQTANPDFDGFSATIATSYGRFDEVAGSAVVNLPLAADKLALRVAVQKRDREGYVDEINSGAELGEQGSWTARAKLLFQATDDLSVLISAEQFETDFLNRPYRIAFLDPSSPGNLQVGVETNGLGCFASPAATGACFVQGIGSIQQAVGRANARDTLALNQLPDNFAKTRTYTATVTLDTAIGKLKLIGGRRDVEADSLVDLDGSPFRLLETLGFQDLEQNSVELQITGTASTMPLTYAAGIFYFDEDGTDASLSVAIPALNPNNPNIFEGDVDTRSRGLYGQATYGLTEQLSLTAGLRYSIEDKGITLRNRAFVPELGDFICTLTACPSSRSDDFDGVSYTFGLDYEFTPEILGYAKISRGFRSGGQNLRAIGALSQFQPFEPEEATTYEVGMKSEFLDRRVRLNVAGHYTNSDDLQRSTIVAVGAQAATVVGNAGEATIYGAEVELDALLTERFKVGATLAYTRPDYDKYLDPNSGFDRSRERFSSVPERTWSLSATWTERFALGTLRLRGDYVSQDDTPLDPFNFFFDDAGIARNASDGTAIDPTVARSIVDATTQDSVGIVNARLSLSLRDDAIELAIFGRNLTDERDFEDALFIPAPFSQVSRHLREPRTYGLGATFKFGAN